MNMLSTLDMQYEHTPIKILLNCTILVFYLLIEHIRSGGCNVNMLSTFNMQYEHNPIKIFLDCTSLVLTNKVRGMQGEY